MRRLMLAVASFPLILPVAAIGASPSLDVVALVMGAQEGIDELRARADAAFGAGRFEEAADCYRRMTLEDPEDAQAWHRLGYALHALGRHEEAASAHHRAAQFPGQRAGALYNLACARALLGEPDACFEALRGAVEAGFAQAALMETDADLASVREDPRFAGIVEKARENESDSPARKFDFWVGTWDVFNAEAKLIGQSVVKKLHGGHVIEENWIGASGTTGMSMNFWDPERGAWRQTWVSRLGHVVEYEGAFREGAMRLEGWRIAPDGSRVLQRAVFTPNEDSTVRQVIEESSDGGKTWATGFDGLYVRRVLPLEREPE